MLCGDAAVVQASVLEGLTFDPFSFQEDGVAASEVDIGRRQIGDALVVSQMVVVGDEVTDLGLEVAGQIVVLEQDAAIAEAGTREEVATVSWAHVVLAETLATKSAGSEEAKGALALAAEIAQARKLGILRKRVEALGTRIK
jgi:hypothetical protein